VVVDVVVDVAGTVVAVGGGKVDVGCASNVIATAVGMKSAGTGVEIDEGVDLFDLHARVASSRTKISRFIQTPELIIIAVIIASCPSVYFHLKSHHKLLQVK
jgi:hypothetical protein